MLQQLDCYSSNAPCIIKEIKQIFEKNMTLEKFDLNDLPAVRLHKLNTKFEK